jgi:hypothetical protein
MGQKKRSIDDYKFIIKCENSMSQEKIDNEFYGLIELFNDIIINALRDPKAKDIFNDCDLSWLMTNLK